MRTTWDIDADVLIAIKERARKERKSAGKLASNLLRNSLTGRKATHTHDDDSIFEYKNGIPLLRSRGEIITAEHVRKLLEEEDY